MRILALDSSGLVAGVAVVEATAGQTLTLSEFTIHYKKTHSETLLPMIDQALRIPGIDKASLDAIAVASGPGSFTGLRIGAATAKGLASVLAIPILPVPTLEGLAWNLWGSDGLICPIMDARRGQVYTGIYEIKEGKLQTIQKQDVLEIQKLGEQLKQQHKCVTFLGDGVPVFRGILEQWQKEGLQIRLAPGHLNRQRAASVGILGLTCLEEGKAVSAADFRPDYLRLSQAERERKEKREHDPISK